MSDGNDNNYYDNEKHISRTKGSYYQHNTLRDML